MTGSDTGCHGMVCSATILTGFCSRPRMIPIGCFGRRRALIAKPCLVLLGEPGIGKTFALREAARQATPARSEAKILERNLGNYASDTHLVEDVFNSVEFHWWNAR